MNNIKHDSSFQNTVIGPILSMIDRFPGKNAFCISETFCTYSQFGQCISRIRPVIKDLSRDERHIGLVANDDIETYASIFALWLEGKAYVPLHPNQPLDRCEEIIKQININTSSADEMKVHPYIRYALANAIVQYRGQHGKFSSVAEIKKIMIVTDELYKKLEPYLVIQ